MKSGSALSGKRVLIVEDEALVAMLIEDTLLDIDAVIASVEGSASRALALLDKIEIDAALVDVNLGGETSMGVAERLKDAAIPFVFLTGYGRDGVPTQYSDIPVLQKPFTSQELASFLESVFAQV